MTDLIYTATEARNDFFNLLIAAEKKDRRVVVTRKNKKFHLVPLDEEVTKKPTWDDFFGKGSKKVAADIIKVKKMVDKHSETKRKLW